MTLRKVVCVSFLVAAHFSLLTPKLGADNPTKFESRVTTFLAKYCFDCHDDETQKGDVAFHELNEVNAGNARLWKSIWEQVALKEMPPKKKKTQPNLEERQQLAELIVTEMQRVLKERVVFMSTFTHQKAIFWIMICCLVNYQRTWNRHPLRLASGAYIHRSTSPDSTN